MAKNHVPKWRGPDYPRVPPGRYQAFAVGTQGPEWLFEYRRWSLLVRFELWGESVRVCAFFNMGDQREVPRIGRRSNYFHAWTLANGEMPRKGQDMDPQVFLEGQVYEIEVEDSRKNADEGAKADAEVYSKVTKIISVERRPPQSFNQKSINQES